MKDAVCEWVCSSAAMTIDKRLWFRTLNLKPYRTFHCVNFLLEEQTSPTYWWDLGTLLPPQKGQGGSVPLHCVGFADNCRTGLQNGRSWVSQGFLVKAKQNWVHFSMLLLALPIFKIILLFLDTALADGLHFSWMFGCVSEGLVCVSECFPPFLGGAALHVQTNDTCCYWTVTVCCCSRPRGSIMWSAQQIWGKKTLFKVNPMISQPSLTSAFSPSFPSLAPRSVISPVNHPWHSPVRAGAVGTCCRAGMLAACRLDRPCYTQWHLWKVPARQHGHLLPRWLVAILPFWVSLGPPGKQSVPRRPPPRSGWVCGSAQPDGEHPGPRPATCSGGCCPTEAWSLVWLTWGNRKRLFIRRNLSGSCTGLGGSFLVKERILLGKKSCLYLSISSIGEKSCLYLSIC